MKLSATENNRLASYCIFDKYGIVDDYIFEYLEDLKKNVRDIIITANGKLQPEYKTKLEKFGEVYVRENKGLDVAAHKEVILRIGFDKLAEYDEIILQNDTLFGPVYPLAETFEKMATEDLDFWGITKYYHEENVPQSAHPNGFIPEHINTSFLVCRKSLVGSKEFKKYWNKLPNFTTYLSVVNNHESVFTKHFENLGFKWTISVNTDSLKKQGLHYPLIQQPLELIRDLQCPVFKRRLFFLDPTEYFAWSMGNIPEKLLSYLKAHTNYSTDLVYKNIIRTVNPYILTKNLGLYKTLPKHYLLPDTETSAKKQKVALVMHSYFTDLVPYLLKYASNMPEYADIYITTGSEEKAQKLREEVDSSGLNKHKKVEVRVIENRGRDVSALLVGAADLVNKYDLICYVHDKKSEYIKPHSIGETWSDKLFECNLSSAEYVQNVIKEFRQDKFLGMTFPFAPFHGGFLPVLASNVAWNTNRDEDGNFSGVLKLLSKMELHVELDIAQPPVCPLGTMFWFRTSALKKLFALNWKYEDFPPEPNNLDGTILHTIERAYSPIVQGSGYYCAYIMPDNIATTEYNNLQVCTNSLYEAVLDSRIPRNSYNAILAHLNIRFDTTSRLRRLYGNAMHILVQIYHKMIGKT